MSLNELRWAWISLIVFKQTLVNLIKLERTQMSLGDFNP